MPWWLGDPVGGSRVLQESIWHLLPGLGCLYPKILDPHLVSQEESCRRSGGDLGQSASPRRASFPGHACLTPPRPLQPPPHT